MFSFIFSGDDKPVIIDLYDNKARQYYNQTQKILGDPVLAKEAVQDAFIDLMNLLGKGRSLTVEEMEEYVTRAIMDKAAKTLQGPAGEKDGAGPLPDLGEILAQRAEEDFQDRLKSSEQGRLLWEAAHCLPIIYRQYLALLVYHLKNAEIAACMHIAPASVPVLRSRALEELRAELRRLREQKGEGPV